MFRSDVRENRQGTPLILTIKVVNVANACAAVAGADVEIWHVDAAGDYTGELAYYGYGPYKADAIRALASREGFDLAESYAYSDSITDEPMLRAVGNPVAVNPDRELARVARDEGWPIMRFERPVRLRSRMPVPSRSTMAVTGAVAAVGVGLLVWWWLRHREYEG